MKKILTVGVYDFFHLGHLNLFKQCKKYGDYLIVAVQESEAVLKYKPDTKLIYTTAQRVDLIQNLKIVDEVITYIDVDTIVKNVEIDAFAVGEDQVHQGFCAAVEWCNSNGIEVYRLERTKGISSTDIKNRIVCDLNYCEDKEHGCY